MKYEIIKNKFIKIKKEELAYIDNVARTSSNKILSEYEKLKIYRTLNNYQNELNIMLKRLWDEVPKPELLTRENFKEIIIEFDVDKNFLSSVNFSFDEYKKYLLEDLGIDAETHKFKLTLYSLYRYREYNGINPDKILNNQKIIENPIYIFCGFYDSSVDCYGPCFGYPNGYIYGIYENIRNNAYNNEKKEIPKEDIDKFEKDKMIV